MKGNNTVWVALAAAIGLIAFGLPEPSENHAAAPLSPYKETYDGGPILNTTELFDITQSRAFRELVDEEPSAPPLMVVQQPAPVSQPAIPMSDNYPLEINAPGVKARQVIEQGRVVKIVIEPDGSQPAPAPAPVQPAATPNQQPLVADNVGPAKQSPAQANPVQIPPGAVVCAECPAGYKYVNNNGYYRYGNVYGWNGYSYGSNGGYYNSNGSYRSGPFGRARSRRANGGGFRPLQGLKGALCCG